MQYKGNNYKNYIKLKKFSGKFDNKRPNVILLQFQVMPTSHRFKEEKFDKDSIFCFKFLNITHVTFQIEGNQI